MTTSSATTGNRAFHALMDRPYLILVLTTLFWGGNVVAGKLAVGHIDAHSLMILSRAASTTVANLTSGPGSRSNTKRPGTSG